MRVLACAAAFAVVASFLVGRATAPSTASAAASRHVWTGRQGDVFNVLATATHCVVGLDVRTPALFCSRIPRGRYGVTFMSYGLFVWRNDRERPVFAGRWKP